MDPFTNFLVTNDLPVDTLKQVEFQFFNYILNVRTTATYSQHFKGNKLETYQAMLWMSLAQV